jgi:hypothetical protein
VATSITAFVGRAARGPVDDPVRITSFADFERTFGGLWPLSRLGHAVRDYFRLGGSTAIVVRIHADAANDVATLSFGSGNSAIELRTANPGAWGAALEAEVDVDVSDPGDTTLFNLTVTDTATGRIEEFRNVSFAEASGRRVDTVLEQRSRLVRLEGNLPTAPIVAETVTATGGGDGSNVTAAEFTGPGMFDNKEGLFALEDAELVNLIVIPPYTNTGDVDAGVITDAIGYAEQRRAILLMDSPSSWTSIAAAEAGAATLEPSANAAIYFPRIREPDPLIDGQLATFGATGAIAGVIARTDASRGVWKAPAGTGARLLGVAALEVPLTDREIGLLNPLGVNCLRAAPAAGIVVWGSRTRNGDDRLADEWKYLPVRRTALFLEESLFRGTQWVVFEPNDEPLWSQIRLNLGAFMHNLFRQRAFQGTSPREAYFVKCDRETTTQNDIDRGIVNIVVAFAPLKPAEFVVIKIQQLAGQIAA